MNDAAAKREKGGSPRSGRSGWIIAAVAVGFLIILGYGLRTQPGSRIGAPAPDFTLSLFDGGELSLADRRGSAVVVNFWASWCPPCRNEAPALERVWREYEDRGVVFVGVSYKDVNSKATSYIEEFDITYPNGPDPYNRIAVSYGITGVPETFLIAKDGQLVKHYVGPITEARLRAALEEILQP
jgi:cytochrome c biogenesis protein CcmG/thiol:disulfide interchange protein DsbE